MRIAITGANSAVGRAILSVLSVSSVERASALVCCVRSERAASQLPDLSGTPHSSTRIDYDKPATLEAAFSKCDAVIHLPGVLVERPGSTYEIANLATTQTAVAAAQTAGVAVFVLVSAIGADPTSANRYYRTKGQAEQIVHGSGLSHTILRAPLVLGTGTEGSEAILRYAQADRPRMLGGGRNLQQPLDVADLARAALRACLPEVATNKTLDLVGVEVLRECEIVERAARALGRKVTVRTVPISPVRLMARLRTALFGPGFSPDAIDVITADTRLPNHAAGELGIELTPLHLTIEQMAAEARA
jgi:NADH dehydrogenase